MKNGNNKSIAILLAVLAAALYAISTPVSKVMLLGEPITLQFLLAAVIMAAGCWLADK